MISALVRLLSTPFSILAMTEGYKDFIKCRILLKYTNIRKETERVERERRCQVKRERRKKGEGKETGRGRESREKGEEDTVGAFFDYFICLA